AEKLDMVQYLLDHGADPNYRNIYGDSPINWATGRCGTGVIMELLRRGANPNVEGKDFGLVLNRMIESQCKDRMKTIKALLAKGADPSLPDKHGKSPIAVATAEGDIEVYELLKKARG